MTTSALWNLQHRVSEDKRFSHTDYSPESAIDRYVIAKVESRNKARRAIINLENYNDFMDAVQEEAYHIAYDSAGEAIEALLKEIG